MSQEPIFQSATQVATASLKWAGASGAVWWGFFSFNEWMAFLGLLTAIIGSVVNSHVNRYYRKKEDDRAQERHDERHHIITVGKVT